MEIWASYKLPLVSKNNSVQDIFRKIKKSRKAKQDQNKNVTIQCFTLVLPEKT